MYFGELEMAHKIMKNLPPEYAMDECEIFYDKVWNYYLDHMELMRLFSKINEEDIFSRILEICKEKELPELYAAAIAVQMKDFQKRKNGDILD